MKTLIIYFVIFLIIKFIGSFIKKVSDTKEEQAKQCQSNQDEISDEEFIGEYIETAPEDEGAEENSSTPKSRGPVHHTDTSQSDCPSKGFTEEPKQTTDPQGEATATQQGHSLAELFRKIQMDQQAQSFHQRQPVQSVRKANPTNRSTGQSEKSTNTSPDSTAQEEWSIHSIEEARRAIIWGEILKPKF